MGRRGATSLVGILPVDKPAGMTSHDVVATVRRATGEGRVGHAGTLDPMATGLLVVLVGAYTRLAPYLTATTKSYDATITFGFETDTDDREGSATRTAAIPAEVLDADFARRVLSGYLGASSQVPPAYSAIKVDGRTAHRAARSGAPLELPARDVQVFDATLLGIDPGTSSWHVSFTVSKGTYVRALARDIGRSSGSAAHLSALRRTSSGALTLTDARLLEEVTASVADGGFDSLLADPITALGLPVIETCDPAVSVGGRIPCPSEEGFPEGSSVALTCSGVLTAIYRVAGQRLEAVVVLPGGDSA